MQRVHERVHFLDSKKTGVFPCLQTRFQSVNACENLSVRKPSMVWYFALKRHVTVAVGIVVVLVVDLL